MFTGAKKRFAIAGIVVLALVGVTTGPAAAQGMGMGPGSGFYAGAGFGLTSADVCGDLFFGATSCDEDDTGFKIFGGFKFNQFVAAEIGYVDLGEVSASAPGISATAEADGFQFVAVGSYPIEQFSLLGKIGLFAWDAEVSSNLGNFDDDGTDIMFGLGGAFHISPQLTVRGEWEIFDVDGDDIDLFSASIVFNF